MAGPSTDHFKLDLSVRTTPQKRAHTLIEDNDAESSDYGTTPSNNLSKSRRTSLGHYRASPESKASLHPFAFEKPAPLANAHNCRTRTGTASAGFGDSNPTARAAAPLTFVFISRA